MLFFFVSTDLGFNLEYSFRPTVNALAFRASEMCRVTGWSLSFFNQGKHWEQITQLAGSALLINSLVVCGTNVFAGTNLGVYVLNIDDNKLTAVKYRFTLNIRSSVSPCGY